MNEPDPAFAEPRLAALYDLFEDDREDLEMYAALVEELVGPPAERARVIDVGCGTGELAVRLARRGLEVLGVDPAAASIEVARRKDGAERVRWVVGDATALAREVPSPSADLAVMTGNVAQVFVDDVDWMSTLSAVRAALRPGGHLVFETRRPEARAWEEWVPELTMERVTVQTGLDEVTVVESWFDLLDVAGVDGSDGPLTVSFRWTYVFDPDGPAPETLSSDSTIRFRDRAAIETDLDRAGFDVIEVRDAPDRPGREWVFIARARVAANAS